MEKIKKVRIGKRDVGDKEPCLIIAEAGSNHNGKYEQAKKLVDLAKDAGADAVKFQVFRAEKIYPKSAGYSSYLEIQKPIYEIIKDMELPYDWIPKLSDHCEKKGLIFLASVFDEGSVDMLDDYVPAHKIASYELNHIPLIKHAAKKRKPLIMSVGASSLEEIDEAVAAAHEEKNADVCLMQCTAKYPAPLVSINLKAIESLKKRYKIPVGLSDHSRDPLIAPLGAVACGANLIEKHFTIDNNLPGPDHKFAVEPKELKEMVKSIRLMEEAMGSGEKHVLPIEKELYDFGKRAVYSTNGIKKGEVFTQDNIAVLRPGVKTRGLHPRYYEKIIGKRASGDIKSEEPITDVHIGKI